MADKIQLDGDNDNDDDDGDGNDVNNDNNNDNTVSYRDIINIKTNRHTLTDLAHTHRPIQTHTDADIQTLIHILTYTYVYSHYMHVCTLSHSS